MASDITPEALGFLAAVGVFVVVLAVIFLFITKRLCFWRVGGLPCLEQPGPGRKSQPGLRQGLEFPRRPRLPPRGSPRSGPSRGGEAQEDEASSEPSDCGGLPETPFQPIRDPQEPDRDSQEPDRDPQEPDRDPRSQTGTLKEPSLLHPGATSSTWTPEGEQPPLEDSYHPEAERLQVRVIAAQDIPDKTRSGTDCHQVHVVLLPAKRQRHRTSARKGPLPRFDDTFRFSRLDPSSLPLAGLRFRLYALGGRMARERLVGESLLRLGGLNPEGGTMETSLVLEPRSNLKSVDPQVGLSPGPQGEGVLSGQALAHGGAPELLVGLSYKATTGRMSVEILKGSHFRNLAVTRPPDTYCRLVLLNSVGQEISRCKTSVRRGQPNPVFKETFVFQVALFQLSDVTLMVSIYSRRSMKRKEMVGWVGLGHNSSGEEELLHWQDMKEGQGQWVCRWHMLLEA
ncbi:hypothetical protein NHX12_000045 [Muraenolepis orangiensis]|uniref:C2 domain-containing protein n=1 Tax=Muraenolepis orangiensis TaxID=630683 RepID=A0A9Q0D6X9_9TELE|nr:hypothetical protein NHX12_000045 [Muraenolepis orangiensis]